MHPKRGSGSAGGDGKCTLEVGRWSRAADGYEIVYPNDDRCAYINIVYRARVVDGIPTPDGQEVSECRWVIPDDLLVLNPSRFTRQLLAEVGIISAP